MLIEVRREWLGWAMSLGLAAALMLVGRRVSPRTADGQPILLLPEVRRVEQYRQQAGQWARRWSAQAAQLQATLAAPDADLFALSQAAQQTLAQAVELANAVDTAEAPAALIGLHDQAAAAAQAFVAASLAANRWLSAPSADNLGAARAAYQLAAARLADLDANVWVTADNASPVTPQP